MFGPGPLFFLTLFAFIAYGLLVSLERKRQKRFFLGKQRDKLDRMLDDLVILSVKKVNYLSRHFIKLSWYYSIHRLLRVFLTTLVKVYDFFEEVFLRNRDRARKLKMERKHWKQRKGYLGLVADHKESIALNESEKKDLKKKKLERE